MKYRPAYAVIQEGGSSSEAYLSLFETEENAENYRTRCWEDGAYRTSPVFTLTLDENDSIHVDEVAELVSQAAARDYE